MKAKGIETALEKVSRVITDQYGLRLVCEGNSCKTDGKTIYLPSLPEDVPEQLLGAIRGCADHECAHAIYTQTRLGPKFREQHGAEAFAILNALEDARVERLMARRYPGAGLNIRDAFRFLSESRRGSTSSDVFRSFVAALYTRASGRPDQPWVSPEGYTLAQECRQELSELKSCRSTRQTARLALRIWEKLREKVQAEAKAAGRPETEQESAKEGADGSGEGSGGGPAQESDEESDDGSRAGPPSQDMEPGSFTPMEELRRLVESQLRSTSSSEAGAYRVYTTRYDVVEVPEPDPSYHYRQEILALRPYVSGLRRQLLQTLMGRRESRWLGDRSRGRLDPRALHRLTTGHGQRIFRHHVETGGGRTACTLLLDLSSSMSGAQIELCRQLALIFAELLHIVGFPTEIIGFSTVDRDLRSEVAQETGEDQEELARRFTRMVPLYHAIFKAFEEPWRGAAPRMGQATCKALTPLGESLLFAGRRLLRRPERRKVLFCLTDGKPVVGAWDEQVTMDHACWAVKRLSAAGIEPVGVGILEECVATIFPRHAVIHKPEELPKSFLKELCSVLAVGR